MIYNFLSVYGIYYPSGTTETRAKWRICIILASTININEGHNSTRLVYII